MAIGNPLHLLEQATMLLTAAPGRKPRQANLRRAISTAYYAIFHHLLTAVSDEFVDKSLRGESRYSLVYRSIDHAAIRRVCEVAGRRELPAKYRSLLPTGQFEDLLRQYAGNFLVLQSRRHEADYDPAQTLSSVDVHFSIYLAQSAIQQFDSASSDGRKLFLSLLLFSPR